jgi:hypothetical protein
MTTKKPDSFNGWIDLSSLLSSGPDFIRFLRMEMSIPKTSK